MKEMDDILLIPLLTGNKIISKNYSLYFTAVSPTPSRTASSTKKTSPSVKN